MRKKLKAAGISLLLGLASSITVWLFMWAYAYWAWRLTMPGGSIGIRI